MKYIGMLLLMVIFALGVGGGVQLHKDGKALDDIKTVEISKDGIHLVYKDGFDILAEVIEEITE